MTTSAFAVLYPFYISHLRRIASLDWHMPHDLFHLSTQVEQSMLGSLELCPLHVLRVTPSVQRRKWRQLIVSSQVRLPRLWGTLPNAVL